MDVTEVMGVMQEAMLVVIKLAGPLLLLSMLVGVAVAIFQAVTQIHEQTLGFILKLAAVGLVLIVGGGWMLENLQEFTVMLFDIMTG